MTDTSEIADCVDIYLAARTVVHARHNLRSTLRARLRRHAGAEDLSHARHALAAARAEFDAHRGGAGWCPGRRAHIDSTRATFATHAARTGGYQVDGSLHASLLARSLQPA